MHPDTHFSQNILVFHGRRLPEKGSVVGYGAIIHYFDLPLPLPRQLAIISEKNQIYTTDQWRVFSSRYQPEETLYKQLVFALKYEGINLLAFKKLFEQLSSQEVVRVISEEPTGQYSRKIWFLFEWLLKKNLDVPDLKLKNYVLLVDQKVQYGLDNGTRSRRHRIINNLPGVVDFCPLIFRTEKLQNFQEQKLSAKKEAYLQGIRKDILQRASAFLLLKDSKASFSIEGESPKSRRAARWGQAIGQAGIKTIDHEEFARLQQLIIENPRFLEMGYRRKGGFVGEHDRSTGEPLPDHISARHDDIHSLMEGLVQTNQLLFSDPYDAVLAASTIAFGFVFIHPFEDGNGRIHRYLVHHVLAKKAFSKKGIIFPVSASILDHLDEYRQVLEEYSIPLLDYIEWEETTDHNVVVQNNTKDYYRYYDATPMAEFLYACVKETIDHIIPKEVEYLVKYEEMKQFLDNEFEMPDKKVSLLIRFLEQQNGTLSGRARSKEFYQLKDQEVDQIEHMFKSIFQS